MRKPLMALAVVLLLAGFSSSTLAADILLVCNKGVAASSIAPDDIKRIYLGKMSRWEDGTKVNFVLLKDETLKPFLSTYVKKSPKQFAKFWKKQVFTGKGKMPPTLSKAREVVDFVANTQGGIGFVPAGTSTDQVKVLSITQ